MMTSSQAVTMPLQIVLLNAENTQKLLRISAAVAHQLRG